MKTIQNWRKSMQIYTNHGLYPGVGTGAGTY